MQISLSQFEEMVRNKNEITRIALDCTAFVLRRARSLPPDQQRHMLTLLTNLISVQQEEDDFTSHSLDKSS